MRFIKEKGKRYIKILIVCAMMIGLFPVGVYAANPEIVLRFTLDGQSKSFEEVVKPTPKSGADLRFFYLVYPPAGGMSTASPILTKGGDGAYRIANENFSYSGIWDLSYTNVDLGLTEFCNWPSFGDQLSPGNQPLPIASDPLNVYFNYYTVTFKDIDTVLDTQIVLSGQTPSTPSTPTKTGYTFAGWSPSITSITSVTTYTATWEATSYPVTINVRKDGAPYGTGAPTITFGTTSASAVANGTSVANGTYNIYANGTDTGKDVTVSGSSTSVDLNYYTVTFKNDDNTSTLNTQTVLSGQNAVFGGVPPTKTDTAQYSYTFSKWVTTAGGATEATLDDITAAKTVYASFTETPKNYTISFESVGGSEVASINQGFGTTITAPNNPTRIGYTFATWSPAVPTTMPAADMTLVAQWSVNQYTINFNSNGGSDVDPITVNYGTAVTEPTAPTKEGYAFAGWSPALPTAMPAENITLVAQWTINQYGITFDSNGGTAVSTITQNFGTMVVAPNNPTRTGYTFAGWSTTVPTTMPAENITLVAQWSINQYGITFDSNGGTAVSTITKDFGATIVAPSNPTREGCTFIGWSQAVPTTMPAFSLALVANWKANTPAAPDVTAKTATSITIMTETGYEYSVNGTDWYSGTGSYTFTDLSAGTAYSLVCRVAAVTTGNTSAASDASTPLTVWTKSTGSTTVPTPDVVTYNPNVTLGEITLPENWAWSIPTTIPTVAINSYSAVYTPTDTTSVDYSSVEGYDNSSGTVIIRRTIDLTINPATPTVALVKKTAVFTGSVIEIGEATVTGIASEGVITANYEGSEDHDSLITYTYYTKDTCTNEDKTTVDKSGAETIGGAPKTGGTYYVKATIPSNGNYAGAESAIVTLTIYYPSSGQNLTSAPVIVDGKTVDMGTSEVKGNITTVVVDQKKMTEQLNDAKDSVVIPITSKTDTASAQLVMQNVESMAQRGVSLTVMAGDVSYSIPSGAVDTKEALKALGASDSSKVPFNITISKLSKSSVTIQKGTLMVPPVAFTVTATYNGKSVEVEKFGSYVQRVIEIPAGIDPKSITTAVVLGGDGTQRHVPTEVYKENGKWYARINSMTNSVYGLIENRVSFTDTKSKWYHESVTEMASREIISGIGENMFAGERAITRAEFSAILVRALGLPTESQGAEIFSDVNPKRWYYGAVGTAYEYGLVTGKSREKFDPTGNITRQEAMTMIARAAALALYQGKSDSLSGFSDVDGIKSWALDAVKFNVGSGLIVGNKGKLRPQDEISRAETAAVVLRMLQNSKLIDVRE